MFTEFIDTDRFVLRVPRSTDGAAVYAAVADVIEQLRGQPGAWPWAVQQQSVAVSTAHCERARENFERGQKWSLFVFDRATESVVGNLEFHTIHKDLNMWEFGCWARPSQQRRGAMNESMTALFDWMKSNNPDIEILSKHNMNNFASIQMMKKVGFKSVGVYQIDGYVLEMLSSNPRS